MSAPIVAYPDAGAQAAAIADIAAGTLRAAIAARGRARMAVAGGATPAEFLRALSARPLDWPRVTVAPTDERCVPADHPRSNARMIGETLLQGPAAAARFAPLYADETPEDAARKADAAVRAHLAPLDLCVLGMGEDGHVASLFPGAEGLAAALDPAGRALVAAICAPGASEARITLTAAALLGAERLILLIRGAGKRTALDAVLSGDLAEAAPMRVMARGAGARLMIAWAP